MDNVRFNIGTGRDDYNMKRGYVRHGYVNDYIFVESPNTRVDGGREYYGEIIFDYSEHISFGPGIMYSNGSQDISEWFRFYQDDYNSRRPEPRVYGVSLTAPYLKFQYRSVLNVLKYSANADLYYCFGSLSATMVIPGAIPPEQLFERIDFNSSGWGFSLALGISFKISENFIINNNAGYRKIITGNLEDPDGISLRNFKLDFSGYFIRVGMSLNPLK